MLSCSQLSIMLVSLIIFGCLDTPDIDAWSNGTIYDQSVPVQPDAHSGPDVDSVVVMSDMDPTMLDGGATDGGRNLDAHLLDMSPEPMCKPSEEVCDGRDNDCDGDIDDENICRCERAQNAAFSICLAVVNWRTAIAACEGRSGDLAVIINRQQDQIITMLIGGLPMNTGAWIGLNDIDVEGRHVWHNMDPSEYRSWRATMPDNSGEEDCVDRKNVVE